MDWSREDVDTALHDSPLCEKVCELNIFFFFFVAVVVVVSVPTTSDCVLARYDFM